jgi:Flp pilus assembly protein TadG
MNTTRTHRPGKRRTRHTDSGAVAVELPLTVGFLLLPVAVLVMVLPQWPEAKGIATSTAKEAATLYATAGSQAEGAAAANAALDRAEANYRRPINATVAGQWCRGCAVTVTVTIDVPAVDVPFIGSTGTFAYTATSTARIDDYRSL